MARVATLALSILTACGLGACSRKTQAGTHSGRGTAETATPVATALTPRTTASPEAAEPAVTAPNGADEAAPASGDAGARPPLETVSAEQLVARIRKLGGKGTLVNAWASWCGPCRRELPTLQKLAPKFAEKGVSIVLVSLDEPGDHQKAEAFLDEEGISLPSFQAARPLGPFKQGMSPSWPGMLPASFLFDAAGTRRYFFGGEAFEQELVPVIDSFVKGTLEETESKFQTAPGG